MFYYLVAIVDWAEEPIKSKQYFDDLAEAIRIASGLYRRAGDIENIEVVEARNGKVVWSENGVIEQKAAPVEVELDIEGL